MAPSQRKPSLPANSGTPVSTSTAERLGWPDGVLDVLNDPSRRDGWNTMAAESANDLHRYELWIESTEELQNLVDRFSKIQSNRLKVALETFSNLSVYDVRLPLVS